MSNTLNAGSVNHGVRNSVTINGTVYVCTSTGPSRGSKEIVREGQDGQEDGFVNTKQRQTATFELTIPTPTSPIPDVNDTFTYAHNATRGTCTWMVTQASETYSVGALSKMSITCKDITGMSITTE